AFDGGARLVACRHPDGGVEVPLDGAQPALDAHGIGPDLQQSPSEQDGALLARRRHGSLHGRSYAFQARQRFADVRHCPPHLRRYRRVVSLLCRRSPPHGPCRTTADTARRLRKIRDRNSPSFPPAPRRQKMRPPLTRPARWAALCCVALLALATPLA